MISAKIADYGEITEFDSYHYLLQTNSNYMIDYQWMNEMSAGQIYDIQRFDIEDIVPKQSIGKNKRLKLLRKYRYHKGIHWVSIIDPYNLPLDIDYFELQKATHKATITPLKPSSWSLLRGR